MSKLTNVQAEALKRKQAVLNSGSYTPVPHKLYRDILPELIHKYGAGDARDAIFIYSYLHAYVSGQSDKDVYMYSFLTVEQLREGTGIHRNRIKPLCDILENEGLLITEIKPWKNGRKKLYMPLL